MVSALKSSSSDTVKAGAHLSALPALGSKLLSRTRLWEFIFTGRCWGHCFERVLIAITLQLLSYLHAISGWCPVKPTEKERRWLDAIKLILPNEIYNAKTTSRGPLEMVLRDDLEG